jgi:hypothetical protein
MASMLLWVVSHIWMPAMEKGVMIGPGLSLVDGFGDVAEAWLDARCLSSRHARHLDRFKRAVAWKPVKLALPYRCLG